MSDGILACQHSWVQSEWWILFMIDIFGSLSLSSLAPFTIQISKTLQISRKQQNKASFFFFFFQNQLGPELVSEDGRNSCSEVLSLTCEWYPCLLWCHKGLICTASSFARTFREVQTSWRRSCGWTFVTGGQFTDEIESRFLRKTWVKWFLHHLWFIHQVTGILIWVSADCKPSSPAARFAFLLKTF